MKDIPSGFQVEFQVGNRYPILTTSVMSAIASIQEYEYSQEDVQHPQQNVGLSILAKYREHSGKSDLTIDELENLGFEYDLWNTKKEIIAPISEEMARKSGKFNYRRKFKCWVSTSILQKLEEVSLPDVDGPNKTFKTTIDLDKLVEAWEDADFPEDLKA